MIGIDHFLEDQVSDYLLTNVHQVYMHQFLRHLTLQVASHGLRFILIKYLVLLFLWFAGVH